VGPADPCDTLTVRPKFLLCPSVTAAADAKPKRLFRASALLSALSLHRLRQSPLANTYKQLQTNRKRVFPHGLAINHACS
jgi:hypothetical protein